MLKLSTFSLLGNFRQYLVFNISLHATVTSRINVLLVSLVQTLKGNNLLKKHDVKET